ncbi:MAG: DUF268 domain-containing protein [Clostridia bacterium]|nr:DUF268 domain-containing protein [Clostridia bacterium]
MLKQYLRKQDWARNLVGVAFTSFSALREQCNYNPFKFIKRYMGLLLDYRKYKKLAHNDSFILSKKYIYPCLGDKLKYTPIDAIYFLQDTWGASKVFEIKPSHHYDVGSSVITVGILSQFVPVTMIDIRPIDIQLENLYFKKGSILELPFENNSIESLSSLCVIEHIGLGRYGDDIDPFGSEKAVAELKRVISPGGSLLISVPVNAENIVNFNAHRTFTRDYVLTLFEGMELKEEKYIYGKQLYDKYDKNMRFGTGLFHFKKPN